MASGVSAAGLRPKQRLELARRHLARRGGAVAGRRGVGRRRRPLQLGLLRRRDQQQADRRGRRGQRVQGPQRIIDRPHRPDGDVTDHLVPAQREFLGIERRRLTLQLQAGIAAGRGRSRLRVQHPAIGGDGIGHLRQQRQEGIVEAGAGVDAGDAGARAAGRTGGSARPRPPARHGRPGASSAPVPPRGWPRRRRAPGGRARRPAVWHGSSRSDRRSARCCDSGFSSMASRWPASARRSPASASPGNRTPQSSAIQLRITPRCSGPCWPSIR